MTQENEEVGIENEVVFLSPEQIKHEEEFNEDITACPDGGPVEPGAAFTSLKNWRIFDETPEDVAFSQSGLNHAVLNPENVAVDIYGNVLCVDLISDNRANFTLAEEDRTDRDISDTVSLILAGDLRTTLNNVDLAKAVGVIIPPGKIKTIQKILKGDPRTIRQHTKLANSLGIQPPKKIVMKPVSTTTSAKRMGIMIHDLMKSEGSNLSVVPRVKLNGYGNCLQKSPIILPMKGKIISKVVEDSGIRNYVPLEFKKQAQFDVSRKEWQKDRRFAQRKKRNDIALALR